MMVYYWAEEPPPRLWNQFAQFVSRRDGHGADLKGTAADVKLFFALSNALHDAGIAGWGDKAHFDYVRPITAIRLPVFRPEDQGLGRARQRHPRDQR